MIMGKRERERGRVEREDSERDGVKSGRKCRDDCCRVSCLLERRERLIFRPCSEGNYGQEDKGEEEES